MCSHPKISERIAEYSERNTYLSFHLKLTVILLLHSFPPTIPPPLTSVFWALFLLLASSQMCRIWKAPEMGKLIHEPMHNHKTVIRSNYKYNWACRSIENIWFVLKKEKKICISKNKLKPIYKVCLAQKWDFLVPAACECSIVKRWDEKDNNIFIYSLSHPFI